MSVLSAIKRFFSLAPAKTVDDLMDKDNGVLVKAGGFINDLHYSDAEKARDYAAMAGAMSQFVKDTLGENTERSKTRREIAVLWIKSQLTLIFLTVFAGCIEYGIRGTMVIAEFVWGVASSELMFWMTMSIGAFFYGAHLMRAAK